MLVILDNARDTAQVTPLLPGGRTCTVLITSRRHLGGLVTAHGARSLDLDVLANHDAHQLLTHRLGHQRITAEPDAVADLLHYCAGLPLALGIVAARAALHPHFPLTALTADLRDQAHRMDALDTGDATTTLSAVLSWSIRALSPDAMTAFGLLARTPTPDMNLPATASLTAQPRSTVRRLLRELEDASLIQQHTPDRSAALRRKRAAMFGPPPSASVRPRHCWRSGAPLRSTGTPTATGGSRATCSTTSTRSVTCPATPAGLRRRWCGGTAGSTR
jgi:hypothetical protein